MPQQAARKTKQKVRQVIDVGVACINRNGKYLIAKRPAAKGGEWEFPGGKREKGESIRACLKREIWEEIRVAVSVQRAFLVQATKGRKRNLDWRLHFCLCRILKGKPQKTEHRALKWITAKALSSHPFPKANREAVKLLVRRDSANKKQLPRRGRT